MPAQRHRPTPCPVGLPPLWVAARYDGSTRQLLLAFKERGAVGVAAALAPALAQAVRCAVGGEPVARLLLVPAPSARGAVRARGDDVVFLLASRTARLLRSAGLGCRAVAALSQRRHVADSAGLSAAARAANLHGALAVRPGRAGVLGGSCVVVVDDLVTTGATLVEASRAVQSVGARVLGAAAVAATQRWDRDCH
jgi:predicted amidophosphoribosyltransferase